ncbi:MAG TPA: sodium/proton-translocating pyrophosphatase, partial [Flavobacteriaceae bacterium]|nr:sodium/proton-translocating pyrophosphatase [Flavobacteriaceae bacterium]
ISTKAALKEMLLPGLITIITPIIIGLVFGPEPLGGYMAGVCVSGVMWAIFQNNAGGAWDNAKKSFEAGVEINGEMTYKGSDAHKAAVTGDTVGDPFKDTSGPSMNILIKLTCLVGLVIAPILGGHNVTSEGVQTENVEVIKNATSKIQATIYAESPENAKALIIKTFNKSGEIVTEEEVIYGTLKEVERKIEELKLEYKNVEVKAERSF